MSNDNRTICLFEVSWEVCNKVGGIHEVLTSKARQAVEEFGDDYYMIGPDLHNNPDFVETDEACWVALRYMLKDRKLKCRCGRWEIPGRPKVILVDFAGRHNADQLLYQLWERFGVDSLSGGWDYVEPVLFSYTCGEVIAAACRTPALLGRRKPVAQFHEWMCGAGLLAVKDMVPAAATLFTTHATMLGRAMAGSGADIYSRMASIAPAQEAAACNITAKYSMESVSAREADVFTTVSRITAGEATLFLGRTPDVITTNGLDLRNIPDFSRDRQAAAASRAAILEKAGKLLRHPLPEKTRIFAISGRYEFHNKGVDLFLEALAAAQQALQNSETHILALCLVMGGHSGINHAALDEKLAVPDPSEADAGFITAHHVYNAPEDPVLNSCKRLGLRNGREQHVQVIFVPAPLDGHDGLFNMPYFEVLSGCDLGVFPSWYEPWGYTPHESAAYGVPTVTTDLSGFGLWARQQEGAAGQGVTVLPRRQTDYSESVLALRDVLLAHATCPAPVLDERRRAVRALAARASWQNFFPLYLRSYALAADKADQRMHRMTSSRRRESLSRVLEVKSSTTPFLRTLTAVAELPPPLSRLRELAYNLWWCWHPEALELFRELGPAAWDECQHNPVRMIEEADVSLLASLAGDESYLARYAAVMADFDAYMGMASRAIGHSEHSPRPLIDENRPVAYFSSEYGLHESLPLYSGGLGVLSGDHLKSASDENIPLVAVGLLYRNGYFRQTLDRQGRQIALYPENDFSTLPILPVQGEQGRALELPLELEDRMLYIRVWLCHVGRVKLYLLDTDTPHNTGEDRRITARLYEADRALRLRQESLLGIGGVRLLRHLGITPALYHMNEGHSAFLTLALISQHMRYDELDLASAFMLTRSQCVFTTHTPVDAGNERFSTDLMERYFRPFAQSLGMEWQDFLRLGRQEGGDPRIFDLTVLALRLSHRANAVSRLHGYVSRRMWRKVWRGMALAEVPITHITNGIHTPSFVGPEFRALLDKYLGKEWLSLPASAPEWKRTEDIPDEAFRLARRAQKRRLLDDLRERMRRSSQYATLNREQRRTWFDALGEDTLIIGFARRFAPYKRATMLFADPDRLARLLNNAERPVVLIFSGKAHPADGKGIDLIQEVVKYSGDPRFFGKIFFVEDYSLAVSRLLVQGCDVWLNTPRRPYEASGTSGEKVPVNGGINLSISDGWWVEGADGHNGWTIGPETVGGALDNAQNDYADAESLYSLLEEQVLPLYFGKEGCMTPEWLVMARRSLRTLTATYSTGRMVRDYLEKMYLPAARRSAELMGHHQEKARRLGAWAGSIAGRFSAVRLESITVDGLEGDTMFCGRALDVEVKLNSADLAPEELRVQLVIGPTDGNDFVELPDVAELKPLTEEKGDQIWRGSYSTRKNGRYAYGIRVFPVTAELADPLKSNLVLWG